MKKLLILVSLSFIFLTTGCFKRDTMEDITIYTTVYPIEYITSRLYGENSEVLSIYPDGTVANEYKLTEKQIKDYSKAELFIFNGLSEEKNYVSNFFEHNKSSFCATAVRHKWEPHRGGSITPVCGSGSRIMHCKRRFSSQEQSLSLEHSAVSPQQHARS